MIEMTSKPVYRLLFGLFICLAWLTGAPSVGTAVADVFEVRNVSVDVTDESATLARKKALQQGSRIAFQRLMERLTLLRDRARLPRLEQEEIASFVRDFSVRDEKTASKRYLAKLNYRFRKDEIRSLLKDFNLPFAETQSKPVLVLPVYRAGGAIALWDDPNPWRNAWARTSRNEGLVPLVQPAGDLADVGSIGPEQAVQGDRERLQAIADRYATGDVIVADAQLKLDPAVARQGLEVFVTRYGNDPEPLTEQLLYRQGEGETVDQLLNRAVVEVADYIENQWKEANLLKLNRPNIAAVAIPIIGLKDWLAVKQRLKAVALVREAELVLLSLDEARVNLHYVGDPEQLQVSLGQADLTMIQEDGEWVIYLSDIIPASPS